MRAVFLFAATLCIGSLQGASDLSRDSLESFYDSFFCEQKQDLSSAGLTSDCTSFNPTPPPPPPPPPSGPIPPAPVDGYLPVVISNMTTQPDADVYILGVYNSNSDFLTLSGASFPGQMHTVAITGTTFSASPNFSYPLTSLPRSTTGSNDYLVYLPPVAANENGRIYFSIGNPLYVLTQSGSVSVPIGNTFSDPNYNVFYDFAEASYSTTSPACGGCLNWTATIDTTQVDSFSLPIKVGFYSFDANNPSTVTPFIPASSNTTPAGFETSRDTLMNNLVTGLGTTWDQLALPFRTDPYAGSSPTTYLRIIAPKHGGPVTQPVGGTYTIPEFPSDYLSNATYGIDYLSTLFGYYTGTPSLYMQALSGAAGSGDIFQGVASGGTFTFTCTTDMTKTFTIVQSSLTLEQMFSGTPTLTSTGSTPVSATDLGLLQDFFASAFIVGLLGSGEYEASGTPLNAANLVSHLPATSGTVSPPYYTAPPSPFTPGTWYDLYARLLHANAILPTSPPHTTPLPTVGSCYAYDFDDTLGMSSALAPPATTPLTDNVYAIFTLQPITTLPTGVFDDSATYDLTFNFPGTFGHRQGSTGSFTPASSGVMFTSVTSTSSNPFQIQYNGNIYTVYPKYQFLQPQDQFTTAQSAVVNGVSFTPDVPSAPTAFTIQLP